MMSASRPEKIKLTASYLNGLAISMTAVGAFSPLVAFFSQPDPAIPAFIPLSIGAVCVLLGGTLHFAARLFLERLDR